MEKQEQEPTTSPVANSDVPKAQCFKCKQNVNVVDAQEETMSNGRRRRFGKCSQCGGQVSQFIKQIKQE